MQSADQLPTPREKNDEVLKKILVDDDIRRVRQNQKSLGILRGVFDKVEAVLKLGRAVGVAPKIIVGVGVGAALGGVISGKAASIARKLNNKTNEFKKAIEETTGIKRKMKPTPTSVIGIRG